MIYTVDKRVNGEMVRVGVYDDVVKASQAIDTDMQLSGAGCMYVMEGIDNGQA